MERLLVLIDEEPIREDALREVMSQHSQLTDATLYQLNHVLQRAQRRISAGGENPFEAKQAAKEELLHIMLALTFPESDFPDSSDKPDSDPDRDL